MSGTDKAACPVPKRHDPDCWSLLPDFDDRDCSCPRDSKLNHLLRTLDNTDCPVSP